MSEFSGTGSGEAVGPSYPSLETPEKQRQNKERFDLKNEMQRSKAASETNFEGSEKGQSTSISFEEHVADFSTDYVRIKELALTDKQLKTIKKWMEEKINETYVNVNSDSSYCNFAYNWKKK